MFLYTCDHMLKNVTSKKKKKKHTNLINREHLENKLKNEHLGNKKVK